MEIDRHVSCLLTHVLRDKDGNRLGKSTTNGDEKDEVKYYDPRVEKMGTHSNWCEFCGLIFDTPHKRGRHYNDSMNCRNKLESKENNAYECTNGCKGVL